MMDNLTQLNSKTSLEGNEGRLKDLQFQKTEKNIPGTVDKATTTVSLAARKPFRLPHEAEAKFTTVIDDNFTRLENVINENIFLQFTQIMQLLEKEGLELDQLAMVFNTFAKVNRSLVALNEDKFEAARQATAEACKTVATEVLDAFCEV
jgi:hypothetical protein